jgi:hypothetical protein
LDVEKNDREQARRDVGNLVYNIPLEESRDT